jgi:hypothetical protein
MEIPPLGNVIATRELEFVNRLGNIEPFAVSVGAPVRIGEGEPWCCPYLISGESFQKAFGVFGEDSMQALVLTLQVISTELGCLARDNEGAFRWFGQAELGFPDLPRRADAPGCGISTQDAREHFSEGAYAYFGIKADMLPLEEITAVLGLQPTESWRKGDVGQYVKQRPDSGWCLHSPLPRTNLRIDEHVEALLPLLEARGEFVRELGDRFQTYLACVGHFSKSSPGFFLSKAVTRRLSLLGLSLDCDLYLDDGSLASGRDGRLP